MKQLSMASAKGAMITLLGSEVGDITKALGCTDSDWKVVTGMKPWKGAQRPQVKRLLEALIYGTIDVLGLPRFRVPAELVAATVALYVKPVNYMAACEWIGNQKSAEDLANFTGREEDLSGLEKVTPDRIYSLVLIYPSRVWVMARIRTSGKPFAPFQVSIPYWDKGIWEPDSAARLCSGANHSKATATQRYFCAVQYLINIGIIPSGQITTASTQRCSRSPVFYQGRA